MTSENSFPKNWQVKKLNEVCEKISLNKIKIKQRDYLLSGKYPVVDQGQDLIGGYCSDESKVIPIQPPYIIFGDHTKVKKFINFNFIPGADGVKVLKPHTIINPKFFYYFLHVIKIPEKGYARHYQFIEKESIPVPKLDEQKAIVSKLEALLSELDNGKQLLITAQVQLAIYRQSLLKWAFEGKLTNSDVKDGESPEGWKWVSLNEVCSKIADIDHKMPTQVDSGYPYVSTKDFTATLKISFDNVKQISEKDFLNLSKKVKPERNDIIFPRYGTIGKNILIDFDKDFLVSYSCAIIKPDQSYVLPKYVYLYSLSPQISKEIKKYTVETTQANVGIASIKNFVFPLPTLVEQQKIVDELDSKLTACDKIEETIKQALSQSESLRQSILQKAFEGELL